MNNAHLSDQEIYSVIIEPETLDENLRSHLKKCEDCRKRLSGIEEFTKAFQEQITHTEIDWKTQKGRILSAISGYHGPALRWRWRTAVVFSCIVIVSGILFRQLYVKETMDIKIGEMELLKQTWISPEDMGEVDLPQSLLLLTEWEKEDFRQFLNFFSPIQEEGDEKEDRINDSLSNDRADRLRFA